jgi:hypothetical protein
MRLCVKHVGPAPQDEHSPAAWARTDCVAGYWPGASGERAAADRGGRRRALDVATRPDRALAA